MKGAVSAGGDGVTLLLVAKGQPLAPGVVLCSDCGQVPVPERKWLITKDSIPRCDTCLIKNRQKKQQESPARVVADYSENHQWLMSLQAVLKEDGPQTLLEWVAKNAPECLLKSIRKDVA